MKRIAMILLITCSVIISGCGANIQKEKGKAETSAEEAFNASPEKADSKAKDIRFHLPSGFEVTEKTPNNIVLKRNTQPFVLFYNPKESRDSQVIYKLAKESGHDFLTDKIYEDKNRFGYLLISEVDGELYEVSVGIGGVKLTTETSAKKLENDARDMMTLVSSVKNKKSKD